MARAVQAVAAAWGGLQDAEAQAAAGPPPGARARFRCHHPRDARLHWRTAVSRPASLGLSIAWASGLPLGLPASRQCALRQAPPASGQARGGLQPRPASADTQIWAPPGRYSIAPTSLVFRTGARCLHSLQSVMAPVRGQPNTSSPLPRNWLLPSMLERGVTPAPGDARLGCFVRACAARPVVVAAFGGSVTSGLAYKVLSAKDQGGQDFAHLYHRQLASWMGRRWPATQSRALELNQSINLGVPGTGPALTALCLTSMQPRPPDLALVEFGINANARDLPHFTSLLRSLRDARVATIVVNVERYGSWRGCDSAHCRTPAYLARDEARRDEAWPSQVRALEAIARSQSTPVVNLRRAIGTALGSPPYTLGRFMKDCRHPAALGHAWIAQLIVHALQQLDPADAEQGPSSREGEGHCPPKSPGWPAAAHCLRNEALRDAVLGGSGFTFVGGRKPALRSSAVGSWVELRVRDVSGANTTVAQLGFLQSWRKSMGSASVSCAPPCTCTALESLDAYVPTERVSVTRLRGVRLARAGGGGECALRVTSQLGPISRGEVYVVNSLILSSSRTGTSLGALGPTLSIAYTPLTLTLSSPSPNPN